MFDKSPNAVWNLRPDSLALLLSLANVGAGARCLVLENCQVLANQARLVVVSSGLLLPRHGCTHTNVLCGQWQELHLLNGLC
jgi:hypothetical protein